MDLKWYNLKPSNVIIIGDFPYFENTDKVEICNLGFGTYRGVGINKRYQSSVYNETYKTKKEALEIAMENYRNNSPFADGTIPFEVVFYLKGIGWQIFTSNIIKNEMLVKKKLNLPVPFGWQ